MAGQAGLMAQVRKSYSLNDLSGDGDDGAPAAPGPIIQEVIEEEDDDQGLGFSLIPVHTPFPGVQFYSQAP